MVYGYMFSSVIDKIRVVRSREISPQVNRFRGIYHFHLNIILCMVTSEFIALYNMMLLLIA